MNNLVTIKDGQPMTTSRKVAEKFDKQHQHVLRAINNLDCPDNFVASNFGRISYKDKLGREKPEYLMTKNGFIFLVMGFQGKKAAEFKVAYIEEFDRKQREIQDLQNGEEIKKLRSDVNELVFQNKLGNLAKSLGHTILEGEAVFSLSRVLEMFGLRKLRWTEQDLIDVLVEKGVFNSDGTPKAEHLCEGYFELNTTTKLIGGELTEIHRIKATGYGVVEIGEALGQIHYKPITSEFLEKHKLGELTYEPFDARKYISEHY